MLIKNGKIFNGKKFIKFRNIYIENGIIKEVSNNTFNNMKYIDANNLFIVPGLIDIHTHGIKGYDLNELTDENFNKAISEYKKNGTTSLLPTTVSQKTAKTIKLLNNIKKSKDKSIIGVHLEGPYINQAKLGAQSKKFIEIPDVDTFKKDYGKYYKYIKIVSLAPELDKDNKLIKFLHEKNIIPSFGHTLCDSVLGQAAINDGCILATHFLNAMPSIHHRDKTITLLALLKDEVYLEIISDLVHVSNDMIKLIYKTKPINKILIISDSMSATRLGDGQYILSSQKVIVKNSIARTEKGNLAGSLITMLDGVKNYIKIGIPIEKAFRFATYNQAKLLNMENKIGMIKKGNDADLLILDNKFDLKTVICKGEII